MATEMARGPGEDRLQLRPVLTLAMGAVAYIGIAGVAFWNVEVPIVPLLATVVLGSLLIGLTLGDRLELKLPDSTPLALALLGFGATLVLAPDALPSRLAGAVAGLVAMLAIAAAISRLCGPLGPRTTDAHLLGAGGAWIGIEGLSTALLWSGVGLVVLSMLAVAGGYRIERTLRIPLAPCLGYGIWLVWLFKPLD